MINAISPIDGRYSNKVSMLSNYFSEAALMKYRVQVEIEYLLALNQLGLKNFEKINPKQSNDLRDLYLNFKNEDAESIKKIELTTNHDVKAVEYWIKEQLPGLNLDSHKEWVHFGLTSQDINNTAIPLIMKAAINDVYLDFYHQLEDQIKAHAENYKDVAMLAHTHGQPASPTSMGKEFKVYIERLEDQIGLLKSLPIKGKFGGATGNFNAHKVAFPNVDWNKFANDLLRDLGIERSYFTTQIAHYDHLAALFHNLIRINNIYLDFAKDMWSYISMNYFTQKVIANEVGSSAMPHKVNPIDFENAEGNLGMANAIFEHLAAKLPISRLQRDLTDSTVTRNIGVPIAHTIIAFKSLLKGLTKIKINESKLSNDLEKNWGVVAEAIQNILRREMYPEPYEKLKSLTRGNQQIDQPAVIDFIESLEVNNDIKEELKAITPLNYRGYA